MIRRFPHWTCVLGALLVIGSWSFAAVERPNKLIDLKDCVTAECHPEVKSQKVTHGPIAVNACDSCHELTSAEKHTYKPRHEKAEVCTYCHDFNPNAWRHAHKPVTNGECTGCHNPHGGTTRAYLREASTADLCARCHDPGITGGRYLHSPVSQGACDTCHAPHGAKFPKLLDVTGPDLCLTCHVEFDNRLASANFKHKAMEKPCTECHDVHASAFPMGVKKETLELCTSCHEHEKIKNDALAAPYKHTVVTADRACLNCHSPHMTQFPKLMADQTAATCLKCHNEPIKTDRAGRVHTVPAVTSVTDPALTKHGPIRDGECGGCHQVHGAQHPNLIAKGLSKKLYQEFSLEPYELCFSCHDQRLGELENLAADASGVTAFRNGALNLHYLHLRVGPRERNCAFCHADHVSPNPRLMQVTVPYGKWPMPINFSKTPTGGTCKPGCHVEYPYDRAHPTPRPTTSPSTRPVLRDVPLLAARHAPEPSTPLHWTATTTDGTPVTLPNPTRPALLLFVKSNAPAPDLSHLTPLLNGTPLFLITGGPSTELGTGNWELGTLPTIPDPTGALARKARIRGWPTLLLINSSGQELARFSDLGPALSLRLPPYLAYAAGKTDQAALAQSLSTTTRPTAPDHKLTARRLQLAENYLAQNHADAALKLLEESLRQDPANPDLQAKVISTLLSTSRPKDALLRLNQVPPNTLPLPTERLLRARAVVALERWYDAPALVEESLRLNPTSPEAHHVAAVLAEHARDYQKAAAEYRKAAELRHE